MSPPISFSTVAPGAAVSPAGSPVAGAAAPNLMPAAAPNLMPAAATKPATSAAPSAAQAKLHATAQKFEAIFVRQMLASARTASMGDTLFKSQANDTFRQMQDERFADIAAAKGSFGLAAMIEKQLSAQLGLVPPTPPKGG